MPSQYNSYNFEASFKHFLSAENISPVSLKNYLSDLRHFLGWAQTQSSNEPEFSSFLTEETISHYVEYLQTGGTPVKTLNRRLSTLRKCCTFCIQQGWLQENPAKKILNHSAVKKDDATDPLFKKFAEYLSNRGYSDIEIKNYVTDVKNILTS